MYKDYLKDFKEQRKNHSEDEFEEAINSNRNKNQIREILSKKSEDYEKQALRKLNQMKLNQNFKESIKKSAESNQDYMKALKAKIAVLEVT